MEVDLHDHVSGRSGRSVELIASALAAIGGDPPGRARLALVSSFAQGESQWVWEVILRLVEAGVPPAAIDREVAVAGAPRVRFDLRVYETVVEFKSAFTHFFLSNQEKGSTDWFGHDWEKLQATNGHGVFVVTLATAAGFTHRRPKIARGASTDWRSDRSRGLAAYTEFLGRQCGGVVTHVEVGFGEVPGSEDRVMLDALLVPID